MSLFLCRRQFYSDLIRHFEKLGASGFFGGQWLFKSTGPLGQWLQELNVEGCNNTIYRQIRIHQGRHCRLVSLFYHCHTGHAMFFLVFFILGAVCFSFLKYMQISHDCRVVTILNNHIMICVTAEFPFAASHEFFYKRFYRNSMYD